MGSARQGRERGSDALLIPSGVLYGRSNVSPVVFVVGNAAGQAVEGFQTEGLAGREGRGKPEGVGSSVLLIPIA